MEQTHPPEELVSPHPPSAPTRAWHAVALVLALLLVLVLAAGAWARWRPLPDDDAARLRARATVASVRSDLHSASRWLTDDALDRQLDALGPAASPAQQRRLDERGTAPPSPGSLSEAADALGRDAVTAPDGDLAATAGAVAASWWAADQAAAGTVPDPDESARPDEDGAAAGSSSCTAEVLAALRALDRSGFVAEAASARRDALDRDATKTVDAVAHSSHRVLEDSRVVPLLRCEPRPAAARHDLPAGFEEHPARSVGTAQREAGEAVVRALPAASSEEREWLVGALRDAARSAQALDPQEPVAALPGRP
ncbi:hypothetical protein [Kocuria tytonis]|uniref:DUF4439 domain-containing protein n=1 Tax=Kocuria tytonis TaxID=2054280 RepID=A0A495A1K8_9MICC|nr:hypothetical protein [Kocuria tytonis]RKQ33359.1 hypothetical protein C1C97_011540 [Kocuria tytonis]